MNYFDKFHSLSILHLNAISVDTETVKRPQPNMLNEKEFRRETGRWMNAARKVAAAVPGLDFLGWHGEHYVVVRRDSPNAHHSHSHSSSTQSHPTPHPTSHEHSSSSQGASGRQSRVADTTQIELKELPPRRRLDTGFGVDLGGADGCWLERIDIPIDYELVGGHDT